MWFSYRPYVSVAQRRANAAKKIKQMEKNGYVARPVKLDGRKIVRSFWGKAWCDHLESHSDYANRLPRGRTYVRNGSVCDLQIEPGRVTALVSGSELYKIDISIAPAKPDSWKALKRGCAGQIGAVIELLQGRLSDGVMQIMTRAKGGLFPEPSEIKLRCSCPDWAGMCKHVAAAMYGVGARLDQQPELLFVLRQVDHLELISDAVNIESPNAAGHSRKTIHSNELSDVFGIEISPPDSAEPVMPVAGVEATPRVKPRRTIVRDHGRTHGKKSAIIKSKPRAKVKKTAAGGPTSNPRKKPAKLEKLRH